MKPNVSYRLYLVTDRGFQREKSLLAQVEEAILGGTTLVQLREKEAGSLEFYQLARSIKALTSKYHVPLIINDRVDIALAVDAEGVHVGQQDLPPEIVRRLIGPHKLLGVSAATLEEALAAQAQGADYIGVGALFPTNTKTDTRQVALELLKQIKEQVAVPVVGIGGINKENADTIFSTGIDGIAVVSALLGAPSVMLAAQELRAIADKLKK